MLNVLELKRGLFSAILFKFKKLLIIKVKFNFQAQAVFLPSSVNI